MNKKSTSKKTPSVSNSAPRKVLNILDEAQTRAVDRSQKLQKDKMIDMDRRQFTAITIDRLTNEADRKAIRSLLFRTRFGSSSMEELNQHAKDMTGTRLLALILSCREESFEEAQKLNDVVKDQFDRFTNALVEARPEMEQYSKGVERLLNHFEETQTKAQMQRARGAQANRTHAEQRAIEAQRIRATGDPRTGNAWKNMEACIRYLQAEGLGPPGNGGKKVHSRAAIIRALTRKIEV